MRVHLEASAGHAYRVVDALLAVDGEVARQRVNDLPIRGKVDNLACVDHAPYVGAEVGDTGVAALRALKRELDPAGIMNPGKLLPSD